MHPIAWLRAHPRAADALLAATLTVLAIIGDATAEPPDGLDPAPLWLAVPLTIVSCGALYWRRQRPTYVMVLTGGLALLSAALDITWWSSGIAVLVALYAVAAHGERKDAVTSLVVTLVAIAFVLGTAAIRHEHDVAAVDIVANYVIFITAWVLGDNLRNRRAYVAGLEERARALEREREQEAQRAVTVERDRIARELHDVVAHHVSVMVVQAGAARRVLANNPAQAREALASVESVGRQALDELRRVLGVLRTASPEAGDRSPQPGLGAVAALADQLRDAGLPVEVRIEGEVRPLPVGVDLSAYRIVQEALTNALKHAGPARACVTVRYGRDDVELEVVDDGRGAAANGTEAGGHGLLGMRERVELFGGDLNVGPRPGGGYAVRARLPV